MKLKDFDFRIAKPKNKQGGYNSCSNDECVCNTPFLYGDEAKYRLGEFIDNGNGSIELWSGFYDSKGTKIYEGDIVKYDSNTRPLVAVFEKNTFYIVDTSIEKDLQVDCGTRLQGIYDNRSNGYTNQKLECLEVLGNIHENAELLKTEKVLIKTKYRDMYDSKGFPKY
ncbi:YopX family protein [Helicobacter labetoulli]|uniref:YopX family protein n=1 Tax=Helicobacter labetoulli TaxID=2315333 RepID=UPI000EF6ED12|nr:YopX family protein [Helicobacter labetoulli]